MYYINVNYNKIFLEKSVINKHCNQNATNDGLQMLLIENRCRHIFYNKIRHLKNKLDIKSICIRPYCIVIRSTHIEIRIISKYVIDSV